MTPEEKNLLLPCTLDHAVEFAFVSFCICPWTTSCIGIAPENDHHCHVGLLVHLVAAKLSYHLIRREISNLIHHIAHLEKSCEVQVPMNGHIKVKPLEQLGEVLNINIRPNPLLLDIIVITLDVDEKSQTWKIFQICNVYYREGSIMSLCTSWPAVHIISWHSARCLSVIQGWHNLRRLCEIHEKQGHQNEHNACHRD